jgi:hypothetical protein
MRALVTCPARKSSRISNEHCQECLKQRHKGIGISVTRNGVAWISTRVARTRITITRGTRIRGTRIRIVRIRVSGSRVTQIRVGGSAERGPAARESEMGDQDCEGHRVMNQAHIRGMLIRIVRMILKERARSRKSELRDERHEDQRHANQSWGTSGTRIRGSRTRRTRMRARKSGSCG